MPKLIRGIAPALCTPFNEQGELDIGRVPALTDCLLKAEVAGLFVCGSTGEGKWMTVPERKLMAEAAVREVGGQVPVIIHVGATSTENAVELARHAESIGAGATSSVAPLDAPGDFPAAVKHYAAIGAGSGLPFYVYWMAAFADKKLTAEQFLDAMKTVPNFAGIKFTDTNFYLFEQLVDISGGSINAITGPDEMCVAGMAMGSDGAIGSTFNIMPRLFVRMHRAFHSGDIKAAMKAQVRANRVISFLLKVGVIGGIKAILEWRGIPVGRPRAPEWSITPENREKLRRFIETLDFDVA